MNADDMVSVADNRLEARGYRRFSETLEERDAVRFLAFLLGPDYTGITRYLRVCMLPDDTVEVSFGADDSTRFAPWALAGSIPPGSAPDALMRLIDDAVERAADLSEPALTAHYPEVVRTKVMVASAG